MRNGNGEVTERGMGWDGDGDGGGNPRSDREMTMPMGGWFAMDEKKKRAGWIGEMRPVW